MLFPFFVLECKWFFWGNLVQNIKIVTLCWNLVPRLIQIWGIQWCYSPFCFRVQMAFWSIFGSKNQNYHFMLKFSTCINSSMQNSIMLFFFFVFEWKYSFWANLFQNIKIVTLCWHLVPRLIRISRIQWCYSLFFEWKWRFWANLVQDIKL